MGAQERPARERGVHVHGRAHRRLDAQKKTLVARERDKPHVQALRKAFAIKQPKLNPAKLVFLDESGFRLGSPPNYGWAPVGQKSPGKSTMGAWRTMTMIGAIALDGWRGFMTLNAPTDGDVFLAFVQQQLVPNLRPGDLVVMDNLNAHKRPDVVAAIRAVGADVLFLPPYSPEYNPIEKAWAKLKEMLRRLATLTRDAFDDAVANAMAAISNADVRAWTEFAGYSLGLT
jgi:transposase